MEELNKIISGLYAKIDNQEKIIRELQEENMQLKIKLLEKKCSDKDIEYKEKIKLQQRIEKAIEYIEHSWWLRLDQVYDTSKDLKGWEVEQLLEILKGSDK